MLRRLLHSGPSAPLATLMRIQQLGAASSAAPTELRPGQNFAPFPPRNNNQNGGGGDSTERTRHINVNGRAYPQHVARDMDSFVTQHGLRSCVWVTDAVVKRHNVALADGAIPFSLRSVSATSNFSLYNADHTSAPGVLEAAAFKRSYSLSRSLAGNNLSHSVATILRSTALAGAGKAAPLSDVWVTQQQLQVLGVGLKPDAVPVEVTEFRLPCVFYNADHTLDPQLLEKIADAPTPITLTRGKQPFWLLLAAHAIRSQRSLSCVWGTAAEYRHAGIVLRDAPEVVEVFLHRTGTVLELVNAADTFDRTKAEAIAQLNAEQARRMACEREVRKAALAEGRRDGAASSKKKLRGGEPSAGAGEESAPAAATSRDASDASDAPLDSSSNAPATQRPTPEPHNLQVSWR